MCWYVVNVDSGFEERVIISVKEQAERFNVTHQFENLLIPMEETIKIKKGKRVIKEKQVFPGYILIKMNLTNITWNLVSSIPKVTGFLGYRQPLPISQEEVDRVLDKIKEEDIKRSLVMFEIGESVRVCEGPFTSFNGLVEGVDQEKSRLKVSVSIFGRETPIDLDFNQVEKQ